MSIARYEGWLLAGRYRLLSELGRGGMGKVWRAHDELLDREVAVKEVIVSGPRHEELAARTMREARIAARLSHPHIAAIYDVVLVDERPWIVLQLIPARSLAQVIAERGPLPVATVTRIGLELLDALRAAHAAGVLHRDIKPANILLTDDEHAVLTDFGLATTVDEESHVTRTGMVVGTPAYIAPERASGGPSTPEADLWSLGATLYAAAEGQSPFARSTEMASLTAVLTGPPAPYHRAGPLAPIIDGLLERDPTQRSDADRVHRQLLRVAALNEPRPAQSDAYRHHEGQAMGGLKAARRLTAVRGLKAVRPPKTAPSLKAVRRQGKAQRLKAARRLIAERWRETAVIAALFAAVVATGSWWTAAPIADPVAPTQTTPAKVAADLAFDLTGVPQVRNVSRKRLPDTSDGPGQPAVHPASTPAPSSGKAAAALKKAQKAAAKKAAKLAKAKPVKPVKVHGKKH
ncbi:serine/threonine-protein kinase [Nonomuraea sp. NEAU-A123]|uniref:serine/threonine-protein kinase n=1 Tax=Nonomuraea sp. NEAU-A123 TaxID=2839649 RepID=UPI001BE45DA1|nr:serine/threonine-protein kinase [Nonomuraea sp. NEAU-A123]MBT2233147.1 serine/threonine protein kinase [Nonomuraea sp. NEAU-A123]